MATEWMSEVWNWLVWIHTRVTHLMGLEST